MAPSIDSARFYDKHAKQNSDKVMALRFAAPASSYLATASMDRTVRIYQ